MFTKSLPRHVFVPHWQSSFSSTQDGKTQASHQYSWALSHCASTMYQSDGRRPPITGKNTSVASPYAIAILSRCQSLHCTVSDYGTIALILSPWTHFVLVLHVTLEFTVNAIRKVVSLVTSAVWRWTPGPQVPQERRMGTMFLQFLHAGNSRCYYKWNF